MEREGMDGCRVPDGEKTGPQAPVFPVFDYLNRGSGDEWIPVGLTGEMIFPAYWAGNVFSPGRIPSVMAGLEGNDCHGRNNGWRPHDANRKLTIYYNTNTGLTIQKKVYYRRKKILTFNKRGIIDGIEYY